MTPAEQTLTGPGKLGTVPSNLVRSLRVWTSATTKAVLQWRVFAFFLEEVGVSLGSGMLSCSCDHAGAPSRFPTVRSR